MSTLESWLPLAGGNVFQRIKAQKTEAEKRGIEIINLSIGQPTGPAIEMARNAAAEAIKSTSQAMHEYQDNGDLADPDFAPRFVRCHVNGNLPNNLAYLPIPGIKPMLGLIPLACGASFGERTLNVATLTDPGYPTPAYWCGRMHAYVYHQPLELRPANGFLFTLAQLEWLGKGSLLMMNYPHNPSGKAMDREWLMRLCHFCREYGIRMWNDAAYAILLHKAGCPTLAEVAVHYPGLSWAEAYSASKAGNFTGWRIGAIVGSEDFIADIRRIKGDADSGFVAPLARGILHLFEHGREYIDAVRDMYRERIDVLTETLTERGMRSAVKPDAGFFALWVAPRVAFNTELKDAEHFNNLMLENTGVMGVPFHPYIRYAVVGDVVGFKDKIVAAFDKAEVSY